LINLRKIPAKFFKYKNDCYIWLLKNTSMKNSYKIFLLSILLLSNFVAFAQGPGSGTGGDPIEGGDDEPVAGPIDSTLFVLLIFGLIFAFYAIKKYQKQFN
jgi:hypothetical protein